MIVLLDTNSLLLPHQRRIDVFSEIKRLIPEHHELATLSTVLQELEGLAKSPATKDGVAAKVGLKLIENKNVTIIPSEGPVDEALVAYAAEYKAIVCTNDQDLKRKLKKKRLTLIVMRGKNHLVRI
jgi:uncharacterized protein